jgi:hypothetical protein
MIMKGLNKTSKIILLVSLALCTIAVYILLVYPRYHLWRIYSLLKPKLANDGEILTSGELTQDGNWVINSKRTDLTNLNSLFNGEADQSQELFIQAVNNPMLNTQFWMNARWHARLSPNSKSFVMEIGNIRWCPATIFTLYNIVGSKWEGPIIFGDYYSNWQQGFQPCSSTTWSQDGTNLALYSRPTGNPDNVSIQILDQEGRLLQNFAVHAPAVEGGIDYLYWNGTDFILVNRADFHPEGQKDISFVYSFSSLEPEKVVRLDYLPMTSSYEIWGRDFRTDRILIAENDSEMKLIIYRLAENAIEKEVIHKEPCWFRARSLDNLWIWAQCGGLGQVQHLYLWDWGKLEFIDKGIAEKVIGWQEDIQGLLVLNRNENGKIIMDVIKP